MTDSNHEINNSCKSETSSNISEEFEKINFSSVTGENNGSLDSKQIMEETGKDTNKSREHLPDSPEDLKTREFEDTLVQPKKCPFGVKAMQDCLQSQNARVVDLVYWKNVKKTSTIFICSIAILCTFALFSLPYSLSLIGFIALSSTLAIRGCHSILLAMNKTEEPHPFKCFLEYDVTMPESRAHELCDCIISHLEQKLAKLRHYFLVVNFVDTLKFGLCLWLISYLGAWFNALTIFMIMTVCLFTLPFVYNKYETQIDEKFDVASSQVKRFLEKMKDQFNEKMQKFTFMRKAKSQ